MGAQDGGKAREAEKKAKSKVQRAGMSAKKRAANKQRPPEAVETTKIDVIDEAAPGETSEPRASPSLH